MNTIKTMHQNLLLLGSALLAVGFMSTSHAEDSAAGFDVGLSSHYLIKGNYEPIYDILLGAEFKYRFKASDDAHYFVKTAVTGNVEDSHSKLLIYSTSIGRAQNIFNVLNKTLFADYSLGLAYHQEKFSTQLIDRTVTATFSSWEYQADIGVGIEFSDQLRSRFFINQLGTQGTTTGLDLSFKF